MTFSSVAIVTGASQGIGRATAVRLARDFSAIALAARNLDELQKTAAAVRAGGAEPLLLDLHLRKPAAADTLVKSTLDRSVPGGLDRTGAAPTGAVAHLL